MSNTYLLTASISHGSNKKESGNEGEGTGGRTGASPLLDELIDEDGDAEVARGLGDDEELVVVVDDEAKEDERRHAGDDRERGLHLGRPPPHPSLHRRARPFRVLLSISLSRDPIPLKENERRCPTEMDGRMKAGKTT
ncbi:hypothetical protein BHE74_00057536 [Ensete ventricosum]|nr:hypothetical protein BHE74_00057536 [Ensete ventricosum]